ncbi:hypothetical protein SEPCBS57363_005552 [Sporothrix epigloea]|uniref:CCZ1/INTU/HSP4 first Longin domain-containing protein n=1 Tax=Sporothrix epigloea TaxID=1892477 RepID=A0ABP0DY59_9PEZI
MSSTERVAATASPGGAENVSGVLPAQLGFLAIYNPSLGTTDDTIDDQIVYYGGATVNATTRASHSSASSRHRSSASTAAPADRLAHDERNERLRQIGLAQGMVAFGRSFADEQAVDTIETEKTRVVLHELEPGWWMLASIDLTRLPAADAPGGDGTAAAAATTVEYSAREVKPAALLLQDLLRAHSVFLLHHDASLEALFRRVTTRSRFTALLARYWDAFLSSWSVLLHGNPVRDVLPGIRLAASGELGIGVGEEERGSGEREVLEGLIEGSEGLVDLIVCKYGDMSLQEAESWSSTGQADDNETGTDTKYSESSAVWLGTGSGLGAEDGAIFLGLGALSRQSLRTLTYWMEDVYCWGHDAYGIADNPSAPTRQTRYRKKAPQDIGSVSGRQRKEKSQQPEQKLAPPPSLLPPPPVTKLSARPGKPLKSKPIQAQPVPIPSASPVSSPPSTIPKSVSPSALPETSGGMDRYMSIMKLGYGTYWGRGGSSSGDATPDDAAENVPGIAKADSYSKRLRFHNERRAGRFLIPLVDEANEESKASAEDGSPADANQETLAMPKHTAKPAPKAPPRTIFASRLKPSARSASQSTQRGAADTKGTQQEASSPAADSDTIKIEVEKLRVVVYAQRPFLYTFLFEEKQDGDSTRSGEKGPPHMSEKVIQTLIDRQLSVLHKPLLASTAYRPDKPSMIGAAALLNAAAASSSSSSSSAATSGSVYDLIWDPNLLTIHSTIPNIPDPQAQLLKETEPKDKPSSQRELAKRHKLRQQQGLQPTSLLPQPSWSRVEALNTHMQILNMYAATRSNGAELERMCKTSRGWWIVWNRLVERSTSNNHGRSGGCGHGKGDLTLLEEEEEEGEKKEEEDVTGARKTNDTDSGSDDDGYQRAPSDCDSDDTATVRASTLGTYAVRKEIILIRKASDHSSSSSASGTSRLALGLETTSRRGSGSGGGLLGMGRASSAVRAFSAGAYLGFGVGSSGSGGSAGRVGHDAAVAEAVEAAGDREAGWADGAVGLHKASA